MSFNTLNGADDDYVMKFTVSGRWAEIYISSSLGWSGESGQSPRRISDCSEDSDPSSEQYTFTQGDLGSWNMWGDGWNGPTAECGGDGGEGGTTPTFYVRIEDDRKFDVRAVGATSALVGDRLQLRGVVYYPDDTQTFVAVESDWDDDYPSTASLYDAASGGNILTGEGLENHTNVYAEASEAGEITFGAVPNAEPESGKHGDEKIKFHSVYLGIEGVDNEEKENPGGYLIVGSDILEQINVSLDPDRMKNSSGTLRNVTLEVVDGDKIVKIWENADGSGAVISGTDSQKTWNDTMTVPDSMYVEALSTSTNTVVNLKLSYAGYGENPNGMDQVKFNIFKVEFKTYPDSTPGPDKPHDINMDTRMEEEEHYNPFKKCVAHVWSNQPLDMAKYLYGYNNPNLREMYYDVLEWRVNGGAWQEDHELVLGSEPDSDKIRHFNIEVKFEDDTQPNDFLIITVIPSSTQTNFNQWYTDESNDTDWLEELPALYNSITLDHGDPDDPEPVGCNLWKNPKSKNTFYHPDGYFEMRSEKTSGGHGHQAFYSDTGGLIRSGISAGSADKEAAFPMQLNPFLHVNADVKPFLWAAQMDGNPVQENGTTMTEPILHEGIYLGRYFEVRPAIANDKPELAPDNCP